MHSQRSTAPRLRAAAAALVAAAALGVSGCGLLPAPSLPPVPTASAQPPQPTGADGQSDQCAQLLTEVQAIAVDVARVGELLGTDPFGAIALVTNISGRIGELQTSVTDPALLQRIDEIQTGWDALFEDAQGSIVSGDTAGVDRVVTGLTQLGEQVAALQEYCAGTT